MPGGGRSTWTLLIQRRRSAIQNTRSPDVRRGLGRSTIHTESCCRRARFSRTRSQREQRQERRANKMPDKGRHIRQAWGQRRHLGKTGHLPQVHVPYGGTKFLAKDSSRIS